MQDTEAKDKKDGTEGGLGEIYDRAYKYIRRYLGKYINLPESKDKPSPAVIKRAVMRAVTGCAAGFLLTFAGINGVRPFGMSLISASEAAVPFLFAGNIAAEFFCGGDILIRILASGIILMLRILMSRLLSEEKNKTKYFSEPISFRMSSCAVGAFTVGMYAVIRSGFGMDVLMSAIACLVISPLMTLVYSGALSENSKKGMKYDIAIASLMATSVAAAEALTSLGLVAAVFATLCAASAGGALKGCAVGTVCGLACGAGKSAMLGLAGIAAGSLKSTGTLVPMLSVCGVGMAFSFVTEGFACFGGTVPQVMWGAAVFAPVSKLGLVPRLTAITNLFSSCKKKKSDGNFDACLSESIRLDSEKRMSELSGALGALSEMFYALSERISKPGSREVRELCEKTLRLHCENCRQTGICWGREYERTVDIIGKLSDSVIKNGNAGIAQIPKDFVSRCPSAVAVISEINLTHARMLEKAAKENRAEIFAIDYEAMSDLLRESCASAAEEYMRDEKLSDAAAEAAGKLGIFPADAAVYGKRKKTVIVSGENMKTLKASAQEIRAVFSEAVGEELTTPEFEVEKDCTTMTMQSRKTVSCETARAVMTKECEDISGDSTAFFRNHSGYSYSLISDGMGSGREAAITSKMTCVFLSKMLGSGNGKNTVLKMLNGFIRNRNIECFTTVDLLEVDGISGRGSFVKSGAAPSYILRGKKLFKIASNSLPIGITREITAEIISFDLLPGDIIVMMSDGVAQSFEDGMWLINMLSFEISPDSPLSETADAILKRAAANNRRSDDMTVLLTKIIPAA